MDQSDCSLIVISLSDVFKLNRLHEAVGWYLLKMIILLQGLTDGM